MTTGTNKHHIQRGQFSGPIYDVDHLATFTMGSKHGLLKAEDGMRKLRHMEKSQGVWTMDCQLLIDTNYLVVYDKKNGHELEILPLEQISDPTSVVSDDNKDMYNNILLFTVLEDLRRNKSTSHPSATPSEMHIFQCMKTHSAEIVDEIFKAKDVQSKAQQIPALPSGQQNYHMNQNINKNAENFEVYRKINQAQNESIGTQKQRAGFSSNVKTTNKIVSNIDLEVQILNHCFDDIEKFVTRLQSSIDYFRELEKRQKQRKSNKKHLGDGMLSMRAQMPPASHFVDIFQKFKFSFNLLASLKAHIHDPNAPELVHFLFTPLALIVNTTTEQPYQGLAKTVWIPLINKEAKDLLLNCLTSKEQDLWMSLGEGWTVTREEVKLQPQMYSHLENQVYNPIFYDGWAPNSYIQDQKETKIDISRLAFESAAQVQANSQKYQPALPIQKSRYYSNTQPINGALDEPMQNVIFNKRSNRPDQHQTASSTNNVQINQSNSNINKLNQIRNYEEMKKWALDLMLQGAKVHEVIHDRQANNDKELTVKSGELVEVQDDKRNWWRLRNYFGQVGHAPVTILRPYEIKHSRNIQNNNLQFQDQYPDKDGYF